MGPSRTIPRPLRDVNRQPSKSANLLEYKPVVEEKEDYTRDVLAIEGHPQQTMEEEYVDEPLQQTEEEHGLF